MYRGTNNSLFFSSYIRAALCSVSFFIFLTARVDYGQTPEIKPTPETAVLETGKPVEREIAGGQKHDYQITLAENQYLKAIVEQRGIDVTVRVVGTDGKPISEFDSSVATKGKENAELVAPSAGNYRLEIEGKPKNAPAGRYEIRLEELRAATEQEKSLQEARNLLTETLRLNRSGKYGDALRQAERVLEIREKNLGSEHILVAGVINLIGIIVSDLGDNVKAETLFKRALGIYEKQNEPNNLDIAVPLNNLAVIYKLRGDFIEAEAAYQRVLALREKELGTNHNLVASVLNNLGLLYRTRGDIPKALSMYQRSLEIREGLFGPDSTEVALVLTNLASLYYYNGDFAAALKLDRRVVEIREKNLEPNHPSIANALDNLGLVYASSGEPEKAEPLYQRALEILDKTNARESVTAAGVLNNLAELYFDRGDYAKAEAFFQRALQISEKNTGTDVSSTSLYLTNLGTLYTLKGDYAQAEPMLKRALELREKSQGENHFNVGRTCDALARLYAFKGDLPQAMTFQERANRIYEKNIAVNLAFGTEHQKLSYLSLMSENLNQTLNLQALTARENAAREQSAASVLQRKGRVLDAMTDNLAKLRQRSDAQDQILFVRLNDVNAQLAELSLRQPQEANPAEYQKRISVIQEQKDRLETEISRRSAGFYQRSQPITLEAVRKVIPNDAALVEFAIYRPLETKLKQGQSPLGEARYVVYVIRDQGEARWAELGSAKEIEAGVESFRQALRDSKRKDIQQLARALDEKIMQPVRALAGDAKHLLVSPDGELNLIPFEAMVDEQGRYLIENYTFTYVTSGRDLLRMQTARQSKSKPLVIANPTFGEPSAEQVAKSDGARKLSTRGDKKRRSVTVTRDLSETYFAPLGGTAQEARSIQSIFPETTFLLGAEATESALRQVSAPQILHVATHGFFLEDAENPFDQNKRGGGGAAGKTKIENPLLRSGLALAGANRRAGGADDGILTALEASGLNLWGTKLVVLSACDTGVGEVRNGEGVYGLRRAFVLAGAESLVMSMWPVSDFVTRELMTNYYKNLKQGMGRGAALRQVQLDMLKRTGRQHPFYWASFIQSGEWANLDGKR